MPFKLPLEPSQDKKALRRQLQAERQGLLDRHQRSVHLQEVLRVWLVTRPETSIGAYWPIKGEFDALPALYRWTEAEPHRRIGLPVVKPPTASSCASTSGTPAARWRRMPTASPKPKDTEAFEPQMLLVPCVGFGPGGLRLGYGGGFYDRTLGRVAAAPLHGGRRLCACGFIPLAEPRSRTTCPLDAMLTEDGVQWMRSDGA